MSVLSAFKNLFGENQQQVIDPRNESEVRDWLVQRLAQHLKADSSTVDPARSFEEYGLDSLFAVQVTGELEKVVERRLSPALLFENACINDVARVVTQQAE